MNPLSWPCAHRISWAVFTAAGALVGLAFAWFDSPYRRLCQGSISGEHADCAQMLSLWLLHPYQYWHISAICGLIVALTFYGFELMRKPV